MMHDFNLSERYVVFMDLPDGLRRGAGSGSGMPFAWDDVVRGAARGACAATTRRRRVRWFEIDPCYVFHVWTAHVAGVAARRRGVIGAGRGALRLAAVLWAGARAASARPPHRPAAAAARGVARMHRWTLDPASGTATETPLADRPVEFPTLDDALTGRDARFRYTVSSSSRENAIVKLDVASGASTAHELGPDVAAGEAVFVPAGPGARREDDGWLLTITTRTDGSASRLLVLDAADVTRRVAAVTLPRGVPAGFHGSWIGAFGS